MGHKIAGQGGRDTHLSSFKIAHPTSFRAYTTAGGMMSNVWFDRRDITPEAPEQKDSMEEMCHDVSKMIDAEVQSGIPRERIILGIKLFNIHSVYGWENWSLLR